MAAEKEKIGIPRHKKEGIALCRHFIPRLGLHPAAKEGIALHLHSPGILFQAEESPSIVLASTFYFRDLGKKVKKSQPAVMESVLDFFLSVFSFFVAAVFFYLARRFARFFMEYKKHNLQEFHCYMYDEIHWATRGFSRPIGTAFWGKMHDGNEVAVTVLARDQALGDQGFRDKARLLSQMQHENLVRILGYALGEDQNTLIHELMHYGSLEEVIGSNGTQPPLRLDWSRRLQIAADAAKELPMET